MGFFHALALPNRLAAVHFGHHDVHADQIVPLPSLPGRTKRLHGFPAVDGDMTFAVAGKEGLQQKPAGEVVFHQQHPQTLSPGCFWLSAEALNRSAEVWNLRPFRPARP